MSRKKSELTIKREMLQAIKNKKINNSKIIAKAKSHEKITGRISTHKLLQAITG